MNRTLLLIIVDFLFLNLIALTRWDRVEPARVTQPPVTEVGANATSRNDDLVEAMKQSLADEKSSQDALEQKLAYASTALSQRDQSVAALQSQRSQLSANLTEAERTAAALGQRAQAAAEEAALTRDQLAELRRELDAKSAEAERARQAIAGLQHEQEEASRKIQGLTLALVVGETEKRNLQQQAETLQTEVAAERAERAQVEQQSTQLAQGVGQLAQKSGELSREIRDNRPINANTLFEQFLANQVQADFTALHRGFGLFPRNPDKAIPTVLVTDGRAVFALAHVADTIFSFTDPGTTWENLGVSFSVPAGSRGTAGSISFLSADPRIVAVPVDASQAAAMGVKVYALAADPFKFPDAVLISGRGKGYGAVGFRLDPSHPGYVRVDNHLFRRIFGDFAPSRGDLVFSQSGELLGVMVNSSYCALIRDFAADETLRAGPGPGSPPAASVLDSVGQRIQALPIDLQ